MLYVQLKSKDVNGKPNCLELHLPFYPAKTPELDNEEIDFIQADWDELDVIRQCFPEDICAGVYCPDVQRGPVLRNSMRWYGDMAKFIYFNLR